MTKPPPPNPLLLALAYLGFVSLGLPDAVFGIAWPSVRSAFALPQAAIGWPLAASAIGYFGSGLLAGRVLSSFGVGKLLAGSTLLVALGVTAYAVSPVAAVFVIAAMTVGWGSGAVDAGLNTYAARHFSARHMAWLHAAYSAGAALGAMIMSLFIGSQLSWRQGYGAVACLLGGLGIAFVFTNQKWSEAPAAGPTASAEQLAMLRLSTAEALRLPRVQLQSLIFFVYSGVELGIGHWSYTILTQGRSVEPKHAALMVTGYWTCLFVGRVASGFIVDRLGSVVLLRAGTVLASLGSVAFAVSGFPSIVFALALCLVGLAIAPIYPSLMSETPRRVGLAAAAHAVGFQVSAATAGAVLLPTLGGAIASGAGANVTAAFIAALAVLLTVLHERLTHQTGFGGTLNAIR